MGFTVVMVRFRLGFSGNGAPQQFNYGKRLGPCQGYFGAMHQTPCAALPQSSKL
jgi:hypothetical protein